MVKNSHNNKVNNYINIVNDLKGLGLLQRRRRRRSNEERDKQQQRTIYKPQGISGIERTIIDNSPQLRRDVQQLANERSLLDERVMQNEDRFNFLHQQINQNPLRFFQQSQGPQRNLSDVQGDSLHLPSINNLYKENVEAHTDSVDVPIVDASTSFKRPGQEPEAEPEPEPKKENSTDGTPSEIKTTSLSPKFLFSNQSLLDEDLPIEESAQKPNKINFDANLSTPTKIRNTSPKPSQQTTPDLYHIYKHTPNTQKVAKKKHAERIVAESKILNPTTPVDMEFASDLVDKIAEESGLRNKKREEDELKRKEEMEERDRQQQERLKEAEKKKQKRIQERKKLQAELEASKVNENASVQDVANERRLQDQTTNLLVDEYFDKYGGRKYLEDNLESDMKELLKLSNDKKFVLTKDSNKELYDKFFGYLKLSGKAKTKAPGYSSQTVFTKLGDLERLLREKLHLPKKNFAQRRYVSVPPQRIVQLKDITENASSGGNTKA